MGEEGMSADDLAKRAMELAKRAEELARHAHETAGIDEQLAQLEAELDALDAEEAGFDSRSGGARTEAGSGPSGAGPTPPPWAEHFTDRMETLGDRIGALVEDVVGTAVSSVEGIVVNGREEGTEEHTHQIDGPVRVQIDSDGGAVRVGAHSEQSIKTVARGRRPKDDSDLVRIEQQERIVHVTARSRRPFRSRGVRLDVMVPTGTDVVVTTRGGSVVLAGTAAAAEVRTGGGSIKLHGTRREAHVTTGGGSIDVRDHEGSVTAMTGGGSVHLDGLLRGSSSLRTGGGSITVWLKAGTRIDVDGRGTTASADIEGLRVERGHIVGTVGGGGDGNLHASTGGGAIRIRHG